MRFPFLSTNGKKKRITVPHHFRKTEQITMHGNMNRTSTIPDADLRSEVISKYLQFLDVHPSPIAKETDLPYPKRLIRQAIYDELQDTPDCELRNHLEIAYVQLEIFLPLEEYLLLREFQQADALAREIIKGGSPGDIVASARILSHVRGEQAVAIQERISQRMRERSEQIRCAGVPAAPKCIRGQG